MPPGGTCLSDTGPWKTTDRARLADRTLVNLTSGTSDEARETAAWASDCLDGAIMAVPRVIGRPEAFLPFKSVGLN